MPSGSLPFLWTLTSCVLSEAGCCCCCCSFRLLTVPAMDSIRPDFLIIYGFITELLLMFIDAGDQSLHMLTTSQTYSVAVGETREMDCEVHSNANKFNLFVNPIVWHKVQLEERTHVNMMGIIQEPFASTQRLKVTFRDEHPNYFFGLAVSNAMPEDSGNYTCVINGPQNAILISVTHHFNVRAPVDRIILSAGHRQPSEAASRKDDYALTFDEHQPVPLRCTALGGYPPPVIQIYVDSQKVGDDYRVNRSVALSGNKGLRLMYYTTVRWKQGFTREAADDGKYVKCVAAVAGLPEKTASAAINVHYTAIVDCYNSSSYIGERHVYLRCEISAQPPVTDLHWMLDDNGTVLSVGESGQEPYWVFHMERTDGVTETQLFIRQTNANSFRRYRVFVGNNVGVVFKDVYLNLRYEATLRPPKTVLVQSSQQDSRFSFLQIKDVGAVISHVTAFAQLLTHLTITCLTQVLLRQPWWAIIDDL